MPATGTRESVLLPAHMPHTSDNRFKDYHGDFALPGVSHTLFSLGTPFYGFIGGVVLRCFQVWEVLGLGGSPLQVVLTCFNMFRVIPSLPPSCPCFFGVRRGRAELERRALEETRHATVAVEGEMSARVESDTWRLRCEQVWAFLWREVWAWLGWLS